MVSERYSHRLLRSFQALSTLVLSKEDVESTLDVVSVLAVQTIGPCDVASVSLLRAGETSSSSILTVGRSNEIAIELDAIQYETGQGPCLDAINKEAAWFQVDDMASDTVWPSFSSEAAKRGFQSLLAVTLRMDDQTLGALNLYARAANVFSAEDRDFGAIFAAHAAVALDRAQEASEHSEMPTKPEDDRAREVVGRAVGILMEREFRSEAEALEVLGARADELKVKLREAAQEVIASSDRERADLQLPPGFRERMMERIRASESAPPTLPSGK